MAWWQISLLTLAYFLVGSFLFGVFYEGLSHLKNKTWDDFLFEVGSLCLALCWPVVAVVLILLKFVILLVHTHKKLRAAKQGELK